MLLADFIKSATADLSVLYPEAEAKAIVLLLCEERLGTKNYTHIIEPQTEVPAKNEALLLKSLERLKASEPIQYVLGYTSFASRKFNVGPQVLIPRPETEILCERAVQAGKRIVRMRSSYGKNAPSVRILDLCTGSGCIAWTLALEIPGVEVTAVDISDDALKLASSQPFMPEVKASGAKVPRFIKADVLDVASFPEGEYDIVISNPPYVLDSQKADMRANVLEYEPHLALFVPDEDPLKFYRAAGEICKKNLKPSGYAFFEINDLQSTETKELMLSFGFKEVALFKDLSDKPRFVEFKK